MFVLFRCLNFACFMLNFCFIVNTLRYNLHVYNVANSTISFYVRLNSISI